MVLYRIETSVSSTISFNRKGHRSEEPIRKLNHSAESEDCGKPIMELKFPNCNESLNCYCVNSSDPITIYQNAANWYPSSRLRLLECLEFGELPLFS